jgi:PKD repeat protein
MARFFRRSGAFFIALGAVLALLLFVLGPTFQPALAARPGAPDLPLTVSSPFDQARTSLLVGNGPARGESVLCAASDRGNSQCAVSLPPSHDPLVNQPYWTNLTSSPSPPPVEFASMTYDAADGYVVLLGGLSAGFTPINDTWIFRDGNWQNITATAGTAPSARSGMAMTYDAADRYVLAFSGENAGTPFTNDTWSFVDGRWHHLNVSGAPGYPEWVEMAYDSADSSVVLFGTFDSDSGQVALTYTYRAGVWDLVTRSNNSTLYPQPSVREEFAMTYDADDGYILLFGGWNDVAGRVLGDTWEFSAGNWTNVSASLATSPAPAFGTQMTYDDSSGEVILFGGAPTFGGNGTGVAELNDSWSFEGGAWANVTPTLSPPARYGGAMANDSADSSVILFGGDVRGGNPSILNDTWVWSASPPIARLTVLATPSVPLPGSPVLFTAAFEGGVSSFDYSWNFGDGGLSASPDPTHEFAAVGSYDVQLWLNDSAGHTAHASDLVRVYVPLSLTELRATPNPALLDRVVNFSAIATGGTPPYTYSWAFGDGGTGGNLSNITHIYTTNGPFTAEVTVTDSVGGVAHSFLNVSIQLQALAGSTATSGISPLTVTFVGQAEGGVPPYGFTWNFGDGTPASTLQSPTHRFNVSGTFTVELNVVDAKGNRSTSSLTVTVGGPPTPGSDSSGWLIAFVLAAGIAGVVTVAWGVDRARQQSRRAEGRQWIEQLTVPPEHGDDSQHR